MIAINHNLPASNVANTLTSHYGRLQTSTQRLSSGLRINSAADDAAGLAIRELMRSDISVLQQGARNANDAISMIQTFDGALGIIDEKLIRMKELAEQAATGTYNSTQRLMIDSEFQAMADEIDRIARATDFNGIKLLDGKGLAATDAQSQVDKSRAAGDIIGFKLKDNSFSCAPLGIAGATVTLTSDLESELANLDLESLGAGKHTITLRSETSQVSNDGNFIFTTQTMQVGNPASLRLDFNAGTSRWDIYEDDGAGNWIPSTNYSTSNNTPMGCNIMDRNSVTWMVFTVSDANTRDEALFPTSGIASVFVSSNDPASPQFTISAPSLAAGGNTPQITSSAFNAGNLSLSLDLGGGNSINASFNCDSPWSSRIEEITVEFEIEAIREAPVTPPGPNQPGTDPNNPNGPGGNGGSGSSGGIPDLFTDKVKIHFGTGNDSAEDYYYINKHDATTRGLGLDDVDIQTQDKAQAAIVKINDAIVQKDKIRAEYGAMQNRLENTVSNLQVQSENIQAAESRISDTDVATEMTNFVRNQILTQSAVAMLSQANSMPQMVMRLIG